MAARKARTTTTTTGKEPIMTEQDPTTAPALIAPLQFEHVVPTDVTASTTGHSELHNVTGRAVSELQSVVADLHAVVAQISGLATVEPAGVEPAGSSGTSE